MVVLSTPQRLSICTMSSTTDDNAEMEDQWEKMQYRLDPSDSSGCKRQLLVRPEEAVKFTTFIRNLLPFTSDMADFDVPPATKQIFLVLFK